MQKLPLSAAIITATVLLLFLGSCGESTEDSSWLEYEKPGYNLYFQNWRHGVVRRQDNGYNGYETFIPCLNYDPAITALRRIDDCMLGGPDYSMTSADTEPVR